MIPVIVFIVGCVYYFKLRSRQFKMLEEDRKAKANKSVKVVEKKSVKYPLWNEACEALKSLGFTKAELDKIWIAMGSTYSDDATVESLIKQVLRIKL